MAKKPSYAELEKIVAYQGPQLGMFARIFSEILHKAGVREHVGADAIEVVREEDDGVLAGVTVLRLYRPLGPDGGIVAATFYPRAESKAARPQPHTAVQRLDDYYRVNREQAANSKGAALAADAASRLLKFRRELIDNELAVAEAARTEGFRHG